MDRHQIRAGKQKMRARIGKQRVRCPTCRTKIQVLFEHPHPELAALGVILMLCPSCGTAKRIVPTEHTAQVDAILAQGVTVPGGNAGEVNGHVLRPVDKAPDGEFVIEAAKVDALDPLLNEAPKREPVLVRQNGYGRIERNAPCPCGSGLKTKKCHPEGLRTPFRVESAHKSGVAFDLPKWDGVERVAEAMREQGIDVEVVSVEGKPVGLSVASKMCKGIEIEPGVFSGCDSSRMPPGENDCPVCSDDNKPGIDPDPST